MTIATLVSVLVLSSSASINPARMDDAPQAPVAEKKILVANSQAPALSADTWIKGEEVKSFDPDKVYVVEFWATWCGPCLKTFPFLSQLQKDNPTELVVIGVAASEKPPIQKETPPGSSATPASKDAPGEKSTETTGATAVAEKMLAHVQSFVTQQGDKMGYRVVFDGDGSMSREWLQAARQRSIPTAFIVAKGGKIAWIGPANQVEKHLAVALGKKVPGNDKKKPGKVPGSLKSGGAAGESAAPPKQAVE